MSITILGITIGSAALMHGARTLAHSPEFQKGLEKTTEAATEFYQDHKEVINPIAKFTGKVLWKVADPFGTNTPFDSNDD